MIAVSKIAPRFIPLGKMTEFHRQPSRLNGVQTAVVTLDVVVILLGLSMVTEHLDGTCNRFFVCGDRATFPTGTQVLAWIKAECGRAAHRSCLPPAILFLRKIFRPMCLTGVFDDSQVVARRQLK